VLYVRDSIGAGADRGLGSGIARLSMEAFLRMRGAARWVGISIAGLVLVVAGIIMLFTPGPGIAMIICGLAVWARQFRWAHRALEAVVDRLRRNRDKLPAFALRFLDERLRRRAIRQHADAIAMGELPGPMQLDVDDVTSEVDLA